MAWNAAEAFCQAEGGHLASVGSSATEDYLTKGLANRGYDRAWFGGSDIEEEGTWKWADCTPWEFTFWKAGEPNNFGGNQHCLWHHIYHSWDDYKCSEEQVFVCSKKICSGNIQRDSSRLFSNKL